MHGRSWNDQAGGLVQDLREEKMTLSETWFNNTWIREAIGLPPPKECKADKEIAALRAERDDLKRQLTALPVYDPSYGDAVVLIADLKAERDKLRAALEWYSKELPMSSGDIAREVLAGEMPEEIRRALEGK
jgi:hypothetical protein